MTAYILRGVATSLSVFLLSYTALFLAAIGVFVIARRFANRLRPAVLAKVLYALQIGPFAISGALVLGFVLPSFLRFEPTAILEPTGTLPTALSLLALLLLGTGLYRGIAAYHRTCRVSREWKKNSVGIEHPGFPVLQTGPAAPPLVVVGLCRQKLLISSSACELLTSSELLRAIEHESVHVRQFDNLKKLLLLLCCVLPVPSIETAWLEVLEEAADDNAVKTEREAVELASALVKVSRLAGPIADLAASLTGRSASLSRRIDHLLAWRGTHTGSGQARAVQCCTLSVSLLAIVVTVVAYQSLLVNFHAATELLMR